MSCFAVEWSLGTDNESVSLQMHTWGKDLYVLSDPHFKLSNSMSSLKNVFHWHCSIIQSTGGSRNICLKPVINSKDLWTRTLAAKYMQLNMDLVFLRSVHILSIAWVIQCRQRCDWSTSVWTGPEERDHVFIQHAINKTLSQTAVNGKTSHGLCRVGNHGKITRISVGKDYIPCIFKIIFIELFCTLLWIVTKLDF